MTRALCHALFRGWEIDPAICENPAQFQPYRYEAAWVDRCFDPMQTPGRRMLAILLCRAPIGEIRLKRIDRSRGKAR